MANASYIGPRTEVWWQRENPPPPPYIPCVCREDWENYYQYKDGCGGLEREDSYEDYLERHRRNHAVFLNTAIQAAEQEALEQQVYYEDDVDVLLRAVDEEEDPPISRVHYM